MSKGKKNLGASPSLGAMIAEYRKRKGLTQHELAARIGLSRTSIMRIEIAYGGVRRTTLEMLSTELGFNLGEALDLIERDRRGLQKPMIDRKDSVNRILLSFASLSMKVSDLSPRQQELLSGSLNELEKQVDYYLKGE
jgi:transcriptional regulator with XRE-family HTH domain